MTPHISAQKGEIAKTVLMPGDPLRAKMMAQTFLEDPKLVNSVRNMLMYTGTYQGKAVTIAGSGMGQASIGIYSYELFAFYDVENIIRLGSAASYDPKIKLFELVLATEAFSDSPFYAKEILGLETNVLKASSSLNEKLSAAAQALQIPVHQGRIHTSDVFYFESRVEQIIAKTKAIAREMESYALFANAQKFGKNAACLLTIGTNVFQKSNVTREQREKHFLEMAKVALAIL